MNKLPRKPSPQAAEPSSPPHEEIAARAYLIWLERGSEHGGHERDWLKAEEELRKAGLK